ncbi:hypothetical protein OCAE111667_02240 [Occultella aeris]|uniref:Uncharacterized protein n=2 Tax=Occultella TaxID=2828348 RepID=A0A7M4DGN3_9MICO|nr:MULTISPECIES: hypothetical protein [Occultella]MBZ2199664.1 hypothetical protein [Occultella gossypii]VZO36076.1 hypothetical protein HALOF300_01280 [Occultella aeris]
MALTEVFTGNHGTLTLAAEDTPEGADASAVVDTFAIQTVGRLTDVRVCVDTALKEFYEVGRRHPVSLSPGDIHIAGTVGRAYVNGALLLLLMGRGSAPTAVAEPYVQPAFTINLVLADPAHPGNSLTLEIAGVKFENWRYTLPEDDFVVENLRFRALTIRVLDREGAGGGGGEAPPTEVAFATE